MLSRLTLFYSVVTLNKVYYQSLEIEIQIITYYHVYL
jgi:hypothetical protein